MLKRVTWTPGAVFTVALRGDLFTVAQMRENHLMEFFDVASATPDVQGIDLNQSPLVCCLFVAEQRIRPLLVERIGTERARPNQRPLRRRMLNPLFGPAERGAELIELNDDYSAIGASVVSGPLSLDRDLATIHAHELTSMVGDPAKLAARLIRWFDTGVNWDDSKRFLFPGIEPPPAVAPQLGLGR